MSILFLLTYFDTSLKHLRSTFDNCILLEIFSYTRYRFFTSLFEIPNTLAPRLSKYLAKLPPIKPLIPVIKTVFDLQKFLFI